MVQRLLHGTLNATIYEVDRLRTGCGFGSCSKGTPGKTLLGQVKKLVFCYPQVASTKLYATIDLDKARVARTKLVENQHSNPKWVQTFRILCAHTISSLVFTIKDNNPIAATLIGRAYVPVEDITSGFIVDRWVPILDEHHIPIPGRSKIHVKLQFSSVTHDKNWSQGIKSPQFEGVPNTFFLQRQGCKLTLYQDAHVDPDFHPRVLNSHYEPKKCWEDIFEAIVNAKHLIYVSGWSVFTGITLIRDKTHVGYNIRLGELLKQKADEGVTVLLLVWQDRTSVKELNGLMATHDEETEAYFQGSRVRCVLCPREPGSGRSIVQGFEVSTMFTHHQKSVVVDSEEGVVEGGKRRLVGFVGGIDLCDGRFDTQEHALFKTLGTTHSGDFHQPNFGGASVNKGGPREPWHDVHCRLEGPIAWDALYNFEQRWRKQVTGQNRDYLLPITKLDQIITRPSQVTTSDDLETWNVQLFRSIDGGAAADLLPSTLHESDIGLVSGKNSVIDRSIQDAYIHAIRRAKNFIYIENQYFLGSSFGWRSSELRDEDVGALHLVPKELSLKIVSKIEAGERFVVYVVIPMWPEGEPESEAVQAILDWQRRTMEMMYVDIARALQAKGTHAHPWDYLSFFCLGNREAERVGEYVPPERPEPGSNYIRAQEARRFMIYVHSKMMIVDDEYIIMGSANINQRSMDGGRDTEIAMGGFQPHHIVNNLVPARGQIYGFRMSLWYEHVRLHHPSFLHPESLECVQIMDQIAERNWELYSSGHKPEKDLPIHLLRYPISISTAGYVTSLPGFELFPDTKARVLGKKSDYLPSILTT